MIDYKKADLTRLDEIIRCRLDFLELKAVPMGYPLYKKLGFEDACSRCKEMNFKWE